MSLLQLFIDTSREMGRTDEEIAKELRAVANKLCREIRKESDAAEVEATPTKSGRSIAADRRASRTGLAFVAALNSGEFTAKPSKRNRKAGKDNA